MRFSGRIIKEGRYWAVEVPILSVVSQGRTKKEAYEMIADAIESLVNCDNFSIKVYPGNDGYLEISSPDQATLTAFLLNRERLKAGLSLEEVTKLLGAKSLNAYARYEQGRSVPTIPKLTELFSVVAPHKDFVIAESQISA